MLLRKFHLFYDSGRNDIESSIVLRFIHFFPPPLSPSPFLYLYYKSNGFFRLGRDFYTRREMGKYFCHRVIFSFF